MIHCTPIGSYDPADVTFLLKLVSLQPTDVAEKERLIQTGAAHYSEMITEERRPDPHYLRLYEEALERHQNRIADEIISLARQIVDRVASGDLDRKVTLCSLVRAGVPYGVLLGRELRAVAKDLDVEHFGVSIIRGRGLDRNAMSSILHRRPASGVVFVDGWTGKGAISRELHKSWPEIAGAAPVLAVLADPAGYADIAGSREDWLIPSGILGANISGLISRSILNSEIIGPEDFHGTIPVNHLADIDLSRTFVDRIAGLCAERRKSVRTVPLEAALDCRERAMRCVNQVAQREGVGNLNRIKPGIAEATRAVLRRRPHKVYVRHEDDPDVASLLHLCRLDGVAVEVAPRVLGPYKAITVIAEIGAE